MPRSGLVRFFDIPCFVNLEPNLRLGPIISVLTPLYRFSPFIHSVPSPPPPPLFFSCLWPTSLCPPPPSCFVLMCLLSVWTSVAVSSIKWWMGAVFGVSAKWSGRFGGWFRGACVFGFRGHVQSSCISCWYMVLHIVTVPHKIWFKKKKALGPVHQFC